MSRENQKNTVKSEVPGTSVTVTSVALGELSMREGKDGLKMVLTTSPETEVLINRDEHGRATPRSSAAISRMGNDGPSR